MRAMAIEAFGGTDRLQLFDLPRPRAPKGEVLVRVVAAGIDDADCYVRQGRMAHTLPHAFPLVPGWDLAGVVEEFGDGTGRFRKGDRVWAYARKSKVQWGCYADYVTVPEGLLSPMPSKLLFEEAAAVPLAGLTALQMLATLPDLSAEHTILVHAAQSGVGHIAVQLARHSGARILATAASTSRPFVMNLGAMECIDPTSDDVAGRVRRYAPDGVDLVIDPFGGPMLSASYELLRPGGRLVSRGEMPDAKLAEQHQIQAQFLFGDPSAEQLTVLARMIDQGQLKPSIQKIYSLRDAAQAHDTQEQGEVQGKLVINL